ncbi:hypothetical protein ACWGB8_25985 [Kitasatospora sp. NPDC054939]
MCVGQSTPLSAPAGAVTGAIFGHGARAVAEDLGFGKLATDIIGSLATMAGTAAGGWLVNTLLADFGVGYAATGAQALAAGAMHSTLYDPNSAFGAFARNRLAPGTA